MIRRCSIDFAGQGSVYFRPSQQTKMRTSSGESSGTSKGIVKEETADEKNIYC